jgi:RND family efflux transporter MFP subunit
MQQMSDAQIRAPFAGRILGNPIQPGSVAAPGSPVARIIGSMGVYFEGDLPESAVSQITVGSMVSITVDALGTRVYEGKVAAISPQATNVGRLFKARIQFTSTPLEIKPGMFARGDVVVRSVANAIVVPAGAIVRRAGSDYVFVVTGDTARETKVERGLQTDGKVQVSGINVGDMVVVQGQSDLTDKSKVKIEKASSAETKAGG